MAEKDMPYAHFVKVKNPYTLKETLSGLIKVFFLIRPK
jgi:hypothetical protein